MAGERVLSLEEFNALGDMPEPPMSQKSVLSLAEFERIGSAEDSIKNNIPDDRFGLEQDLFTTMSKGSQKFFENISESFKIGNESSNIDMMGYSALTGEFDYMKDVKPIREKFNQRLKDNPINGSNPLSDAIYTISGMLPAMGKGFAEGKETGMIAGLGVAAMGPAGIAASPAAFAVGDVMGSMDYWYKQGAGSLYADLKDEDIDDGIAAPVAHIAGAMYGAIEFAQVDKLMPGTKEAAKKIITQNIKRTVANLTMKYGVNWATEVGEEGLQEIIMSTAKDIATNIGEKTNHTIGGIVERALVSGWGTAKKSAIPMLMLMGPSAAVDTKRVIDDQKTIVQAEQILATAEQEAQATALEEPPINHEKEAQDAINEALGVVETDEEARPELLDAQPDEILDDENISTKQVDEAPTEAENGINQADAFNEFSDQESQPITEDLQRISETDEYQQNAKRVSELQSIIDTFNAKKEATADFGNIKIKRFKGGYLSEELSAIPKKFFSSDANSLTLDELADHWNVSLDEAIQILKSQAITKQEISEVAQAKEELATIESEMKQKNPQIEEAVSAITKKSPKLKLTQSQIIKRLFKERFKGEKQGLRVGREQGRQEVRSAKEVLERRRQYVKGLAQTLNLSDNEMKKVNKRDIRLMSNYEFKQFIDKLEALATTLVEKRDVKNRIAFELQEKNLKGVDNLRKALKLPVVDKMTLPQLKEFEKALSEAQADDEFLSVRKLETVKNTELAGIQTLREAKERLAQKLGVELSAVDNIKVSPLDKFRFDAALADRNPFYKLLVDETNAVMMDAEQRFFEMEREVDELVKKARDSRKQTLADKAAPTDKLVFQWLETPEAKKKALAEKMTDAELDLAVYLRERFAQFRDYLVKAEVLKKYKLDYITHIRRGFLETWKEDGIIEAFKNIFDKYKEDAAIFQILEDDTQNILPLEKFFQFSMHRSDELKPSQNVSKAFKSYAQALMKKQALDRIVPALDIYAYALSPKNVTPRGLQMNRRLIQFTREWINNKKGRKSSLGGILPQGGVVDIGLRAIDGFITLIDLGLNIPVGLTVSIGEQVATFANLGTKNYTKGIARLNSTQGKDIVRANEAFVGKSPWRELANTADGLGDKFHKALFLLFETSNVRANKIHLLGSLTDAEWESGQIDSQRLADLRREIGRWRAVRGANSIFGSTAAGGALVKYKTWAIPILRTVSNDLGTLAKMTAKGDIGKVTGTREFQELFRATVTTTLLALAGKGLVDDDDDSFFGEILRKAYRESMSILGALDPTVLSSVRLASFLGDLADSIKMIVTLEEYKTKSGYKGVEKLKRTVVPKVVRQMMKEKKQSGMRLK